MPRVAALDGLRAIAAVSPWAFAAFAVLALAAVAAGFDRSGWIAMTQPLEASHSLNTMLGYTVLTADGVLHKENLSAFAQVALFNGVAVTPDLYFRRPLYAFFAGALAPWMGTRAALIGVNLSAWLAAVVICARFAARFYDDRLAGRWAGVLAAAGCGFAFHALDLSAHLLGFAVYMGGVLLIHESGAWQRAVPLRMHAAIAAYLVLACLQYNTGLALAAAYALVAIRHNRIAVVAAVVAVALLAQPAWGAVLAYLYEARHGTALPSLASTEGDYLRRGIAGWALILSRPLGEILVATGGQVLAFCMFEMPIVVALAAWMLVRDVAMPETRARARFCAPFIAMPLLGALVFAPGALLAATSEVPAATARGYLIDGVAIFLFAACGRFIAAQRLSLNRALVGGALLVAMVAWSHAHLLGYAGPVKAYFLGPEHAMGLFTHRTEALSLTAGQPVPAVMGGRASMQAGGAVGVAGPEVAAGPRRAVDAWIVGVLLAAPLFLLVWAMTCRPLVAGMLALSLLASNAWGPGDRALPATTLIETAVKIPAGRTVEYRVSLSPQAAGDLRAGLRKGLVPVLYLPADEARPPVMRLNGRDIAIAQRRNRWNWVLDAGQLGHGLEQTNASSLTFDLVGPVAISGWLRAGIAGRHLEQVQTGALPAVELRLVADTRRLDVVQLFY
jgi:hypothetical protein